MLFPAFADRSSSELRYCTGYKCDPSVHNRRLQTSRWRDRRVAARFQM
jgi:hypothetical protein